MTLQTHRVWTVEQVRAIVEAGEVADHPGGGRKGVYTFISRTLVKSRYHRLGKADKGLVKRYLEKVTGLSRAQLTRLIGQHRSTGRIEDRREGAPARPFERRYTASDIRLLAQVDVAFNRMSGSATRAILRRAWTVSGDPRFERLAGLSNGHLYNLRTSRTYHDAGRTKQDERAVAVAVGMRGALVCGPGAGPEGLGGARGAQRHAAGAAGTALAVAGRGADSVWRNCRPQAGKTSLAEWRRVAAFGG